MQKKEHQSIKPQQSLADRDGLDRPYDVIHDIMYDAMYDMNDVLYKMMYDTMYDVIYDTMYDVMYDIMNVPVAKNPPVFVTEMHVMGCKWSCS